MSDKLCKRRISPRDVEELTINEVLKGLEDITNLLSYNPWPGDFQIVAIFPDDQNGHKQEERVILQTQKPVISPRPSAKIISLEKRRRHCI